MIGIKWLKKRQFDKKFETEQDREDPLVVGWKDAKKKLQKMQSTGLSVQALKDYADMKKANKTQKALENKMAKEQELKEHVRSLSEVARQTEKLLKASNAKLEEVKKENKQLKEGVDSESF